MSGSHNDARRAVNRRATFVLLPAAVVALSLLSSSAVQPPDASAAPCSNPTFSAPANVLTIEGGTCRDLGEKFFVGCQGTVNFFYAAADDQLTFHDTGLACGTPKQILVYANKGNDEISLSEVSAANGFTSITDPNVLSGDEGNDKLTGSAFSDKAFGGPDDDTLLIRDGVADEGNCGAGTLDGARTDRPSLDAVTGCEAVDALADPPPPDNPPPADPPPPDNPPPPDGGGDVTAPETQIAAGPKGKSKKRRASFDFTSTEAGSSFECKLDDASFAPCSSPLVVRVKKGRHSFEVRAVDPAGNVDPTPAVDTWKVRRRS